MVVDKDATAISPGGSPRALLEAESERRGSAVVVRLVGEIDMSSVGTMRQALTAALAVATAPDPLVLDLTGVRFLGSAGMAELVVAHRKAADRHIPLRVVIASQMILRTLEITGLDGVLDICPDVATAATPAG